MAMKQIKIGTATLIHGDCLDELRNMEDKSYKISITSPPYNMNLRVRNGKHCSRQIVKELSTKYNNYPDNLTMDEYLKFNIKVIEQLIRVSEIVFYNVQILTGNKSALYKLFGYFSENIKELIVWDKVNAEPSISNGVLNSRFELVIVFARNEYAITRQFKDSCFDKGELQNLWQIKRGLKTHSSHGAIFPLELVDKIITNFTNKDDIVLDCFMGTGTTCVSANNLGRSSVGIEKDEDYFNAAVERVIKSQQQQKLF